MCKIKEYLTATYAEDFFIIQKSKFIGYIVPIEDDEDAIKKLDEYRKRYADATHVCYAYVADILGHTARFSDDGEPSGTAGQPILNVLKGNDLKKVLSVVVRYYGGIKLGTGGLTKAYSDATNLALKSSTILKFKLCDVYQLILEYNEFKKAPSIFDNLGLTIVSQEFSSDVKLQISVPSGFDVNGVFSSITLGRKSWSFLHSDYVKENA